MNRQPTITCIVIIFILNLAGAAAADPGSLISRLDNPYPGVADQFGESVAVSDGLLIVGASRDDSPEADDTGAAYLYDLSTGNLRNTYNHPSPAPYDGFGAAVAIHEDRVLVGAPYTDDEGDDTGAAYLFDAVTGGLLQVFHSPTPTDYGQFGLAVGIHGNTIAVGAPRDCPPGSDICGGMVYVFDVGTGELLLSVANPRSDPYDQFGFALAIDGQFLLVGAPNEDDGGTEAGAAYAVDLSTGKIVHTYENPNPADFGQFGASVAMTASSAVIGCPFGNTPGSSDNAGVAYLFGLVSGEHAGTLVNPSPSYSEQFGRSVAAASGTIVVGSPYDSSPGTFDSAGGTHLFDSQTGEPLLTLANPDPSFRDAFGHAVAAGSASIVVGAFRDAAGAPRSGAAFVFQGTAANRPPDVANAYPSTGELWPPNGHLVSVDILGVRDPDGDPISLTIRSVTQDEPVDGSPDAEGIGTSTARVRAERDGDGNGRVYRIGFLAVDASGAESAGEIAVQVRHDRRRAGIAVDDGQHFNSALPSAARPATVAPRLTARNHPNPFNPSTTISFTVTNTADVVLVIYNTLGQEVRRLVDDRLSAGTHHVRWDGRDASGRELAGGTYIYQVSSAYGRSATGRMVFVK